MQPLRQYNVSPKLPKKLEQLWDLAYNLLFSWNYELEQIFSSMDQNLWRDCSKNPVAFLGALDQRKLEQFTADGLFLDRINTVSQRLKAYTTQEHSPLPDVPAHKKGQPAIAYFSLEYGVSMSLPIYSGGLGILAGDHLKSASDLNAPLVGIGLCYGQGYFRQYLTPDGWQQERYPNHNFEQMPLSLCTDQDGNEIRIQVDLAGQPLHARIWKAQVGRVALYLLDANVHENPNYLRQITAQLYGGGLEMRIWQEILLGIGGVKALRALGLEPPVIHMNEGHSAFAGLERIRLFMTEHSLPFEAAMEIAASTSIFTTHTPVPAGNDRFSPELMQRYFEGYARAMGIAFKVLLALGREDPRDDSEPFCMTVLALRLSRISNGVSLLHGHVSRNMWKRIWPMYPVEDVPIGAITNGVHPATWVAPDIALLYDRYLGPGWREESDCERVWSQAQSISENELWRTHERLRARLVDYVRQRLKKQLEAKGARRKMVEAALEILDPEALTIGFARRFATYKRASLLLKDKERFRRLLTDAKRPIQFIFAGKAHPADNEGKKLIQELISFAREEDVRMHVAFLEDYDMGIAHHMVSGCDVWLNTPRRPLEACGTSGMKALVNGVLNFSTLDGWWDEAYRPDNSVGFAIGQGEEYEDTEYGDFVESQTIYNVLENEIIPTFYDRGRDNLPRSWIRKMKLALAEVAPQYSSHRMVADYVKDAYIPAAKNYERLSKDTFGPAKSLASWRMHAMTNWSSLDVKGVKAPDTGSIDVRQELPVECFVHLGGLSTDDILVEIYAGPLDAEGRFRQRRTAPMAPSGKPTDGWQLYKGSVTAEEVGRFGLTVRVAPNHPLLMDPHSLGLIHWAS